MDIYIPTPKEGMVHLNLMDKWLDFIKDGLLLLLTSLSCSPLKLTIFHVYRLLLVSSWCSEVLIQHLIEVGRWPDYYSLHRAVPLQKEHLPLSKLEFQKLALGPCCYWPKQEPILLSRRRIWLKNIKTDQIPAARLVQLLVQFISTKSLPLFCRSTHFKGSSYWTRRIYTWKKN